MNHSLSLQTSDLDNVNFLNELLSKHPIEELKGVEHFYTVVKIEPLPYPKQEYAVAHIAPTVSNLSKVFKIKYKRENVNDVVNKFLFENPIAFGGVVLPKENLSLLQVLDLLKEYFGDALIITKEDFYDVFLSYRYKGLRNHFLELHAKPNSYRYYGRKEIKVRLMFEEVEPTISFLVKVIPK